MRIFLSYARQERVFASSVVTRLSTSGHSVWWDEKLVAGDSFEFEIEKAVDDCESALCILSRAYLASPWAQWELAIAVASRKRIIPILLDDLPPTLLPASIRGRHALTCAATDDTDSHLAAIDAAVSRLDSANPARHHPVMSADARSDDVDHVGMLDPESFETLADVLAHAGVALLAAAGEQQELVSIGRTLRGGLDVHRIMAKRVGALTFGDLLQVQGQGYLIRFTERPESPKGSAIVRIFHPADARYVSGARFFDLGISTDGDVTAVLADSNCIATFTGAACFAKIFDPDACSSMAGSRWVITGLAHISGRPAFATMMELADQDIENGFGDMPAAATGAIVDVSGRTIVSRAVKRPLAPRWHRDELWFLDTEYGSLATVNCANGKVSTRIKIAERPTALRMFGRWAFVAVRGNGTAPAGIIAFDCLDGLEVGRMTMPRNIRHLSDLAIIPDARAVEISGLQPLETNVAITLRGDDDHA